MFSEVYRFCCKILLKSIHLHDFCFSHNASEFSPDNYEIGKEGLSHESYIGYPRCIYIRLQKKLNVDFNSY